MMQFNKTFLFPVLILCGLIQANQLYAQSGYKFGLKSGLNLSCASLNTKETNLLASECTTPPMVGYSYGLVFHFGLSNKTALQTGLEISQKRYKLNFINHKSLFEKASYVYSWDIPLQFTHRIKVRHRPGKSHQCIYLKKNVGAVVSNIQSYQKNYVSKHPGEYEYNYDIQTTAKIDYIATAGLSIEFDSWEGYNVFSLGVQYHHGFKNIFSGMLDYTAGDLKENAGIYNKNRYMSVDFIWFLPR